MLLHYFVFEYKDGKLKKTGARPKGVTFEEEKY
jgi:hypothetical protein